MKVAVVEGINVEDLALDFTIPGYDIELKVFLNVTLGDSSLTSLIVRRTRYRCHFVERR